MVHAKKMIPPGFTERELSKWVTNNPCSNYLQNSFECIEDFDEKYCDKFIKKYESCMNKAYYKLKKLERKINMNKNPNTSGYSLFTWCKKY
jgi:hypothetical protein